MEIEPIVKNNTFYDRIQKEIELYNSIDFDDIDDFIDRMENKFKSDDVKKFKDAFKNKYDSTVISYLDKLRLFLMNIETELDPYIIVKILTKNQKLFDNTTNMVDDIEKNLNDDIKRLEKLISSIDEIMLFIDNITDKI